MPSQEYWRLGGLAECRKALCRAIVFSDEEHYENYRSGIRKNSEQTKFVRISNRLKSHESSYKSRLGKTSSTFALELASHRDPFAIDIHF